MEEEDLSFPNPFFLQSAKQHKPQTTKATQTTNIKMQLQPFFFYHTTKNSTLIIVRKLKTLLTTKSLPLSPNNS
jgi:hypothetical protein